MEFKYFKIGELFEKIDTNKVKNLQGDLPATTACISNNQIGRYVSSENATILCDVFSAIANGTGRVFYQGRPFTVLSDSYAFKPVEEVSRATMFYLLCALNKTYSKYSWERKSSWNRVKEDNILLPSKDGKPDYQYMHEYSYKCYKQTLQIFDILHDMTKNIQMVYKMYDVIS